MSKIHTSLDQLVGQTPLMELVNTERRLGLKARLLVKLECFNPAGSVKDRVALSMILDAEESGALKPGSVIIEPTSGNTGIGLAAMAAARGYGCIIVMPDTMSEERRTLISAYGAKVVLTPGRKGMQGAIDRANELAAEIPDSFIPGQFTSPSNPKAHHITGAEIFSDTDGEIDIFVAGIGTGGTVTGVGEYLKGKKPNVKIIGVEPKASPILTEGRSGAHRIQGIGAGFVPEILNRSVLDGVISATDEQAEQTARIIARTEGLLLGVSSGAAVYAGINLAKVPENAHKTIVVLCPDGGDRYLSTNLYKENINE